MTVLCILHLMKINMRGSNRKKDVRPTKMRKKSKKEEIAVERELLMKGDKAFENGPTEGLMKFLEQENERTRQHDLRLFTMLVGQQKIKSMARQKSCRTKCNGVL